MADRATWLELAARCEAAKEADREIDGLIEAALKWHLPGVYPKLTDAAVWEADKGRVTVWFSKTGLEASVYAAPSYTASLDAITALIERELPAAWAWTLGQNIHHRTWGVSINNLDDSGAPYSVCWGQSNHTPALALCAAFCRAMAERELFP